MKATFAVLTFSLALPIAAQTASGTAAARSGFSSGPAGAGTFSGTAGAGTATAPAGVGAAGALGQPPAGSSAIGAPSAAAGRTFSRPVLGAPPTTRGLDPAGNVMTPGFPPPGGTISPIVTNTGIGGFAGDTFTPPEARTFPNGAPPFAGNTVGTNFVAPGTNFPPRRALSVNLPPGAAVQTNGFGVPEAVVPPPALIPSEPGTVNGVGAPGAIQSGSGVSQASPTVNFPPGSRPVPPARNPGARPPSVVRP